MDKILEMLGVNKLILINYKQIIKNIEYVTGF